MRLVIAEKPSVARTIASVLGVKGQKDGYIEGTNTIVSWCFGHLLGLANADEYDPSFKRWTLASLPILPDWKHKPNSDSIAQLKVLVSLMNRKDVTEIVNAADAGREGEAIFMHVYRYAQCTKPVLRLWVSSMEDSALREGFQNLKKGEQYETLYQSALCRERADWAVGINATRLFSVLYNTEKPLNVGRVQSPTLALIAERDEKIAKFIKEPFFIPEIDCGFTASGEKQTEKTVAEKIADACNGKSATVQTITRKDKSEKAPHLFDLTTLQREVNKRYGYTAQETLDTVQVLYEKKFLTYPRTDSRFLTEDMRETAKKLIGKQDFTPNIDSLLDNSKVSDHHAIIPTIASLSADKSMLNEKEQQIFEIVRVRLIAATAPPYKFQTVTAVIICADNTFTAKGKIVLSEGWTSVTLNSISATGGDERQSKLPDLTEGQVFENVTATVREGESSPPKHYTEDTLLAAMETAGKEDMPEDAERRGLGTPATRAGIIEKIVKAGFVERKKKNILITENGKNLVAILPETLKSPLLTAEWEHKLIAVGKGELEDTVFMNEIGAFVGDIVREHQTADPVGLFPKKKSQSDAPSLGVCPRCGGDVREGVKGFFCDNSKVCGFKLWKDEKFFLWKKKKLTAALVTKLLKEERVRMTGLYSDKTQKTYNAIVVMVAGESGFVKFELAFEK